MINFLDWSQNNITKKPWLIVGKGPSFEKLDQFTEHDNNEYQIITLNHAIEKTKALIAHVIDFDVIADIHNDIDINAEFLLMPWYPNVNSSSGSKNLKEIATEHSFIQQMDKQNRLLWYNSSLANQHNDNYPIIEVKYFSFDAVVSLLAASGATEIRTIGIDGGTQYSNNFAHLNDKTLLSNTRLSFNDQFIAVAQTIEKHPINVTPLGEETIKVFVGSLEDQWLATRLLEFSIRWRTNARVEFMPLYQANITIPQPQLPQNQPRTPFSFQRFLIPELCQQQGIGIYLDSDMMVFTDIKDLAFREMNNADILHCWGSADSGRKPQFSVMLLNCEKLGWDINDIVNRLDAGEFSYEELMHEMKLLMSKSGEVETEWNSLEYFQAGKTKLLHYTDMNIQPWLSRKNPLAHIWISELASALELDFITQEDIKEQILLGQVRPSIAYQLRAKVYNPQDIPKSIRWADKLFRPPHKQKTAFWQNQTVKRILGSIAYRIFRTFGKFHAIKKMDREF